VAGVSTVIATTLGTMFALAVARGRFPGRKLFDALFYLPVVIPDITMGVSLAVFFRIVFEAWQQWTGVRLVSGFGTIIIAHVAFNVAYVAIVVRARLATMDPSLEEAARDLGANDWQAFWRITFPILFPGVLAGRCWRSPCRWTTSSSPSSRRRRHHHAAAVRLRPAEAARAPGDQRGQHPDDRRVDRAGRRVARPAAPRRAQEREVTGAPARRRVRTAVRGTFGRAVTALAPGPVRRKRSSFRAPFRAPGTLQCFGS
jgi:hypothetical protein